MSTRSTIAIENADGSIEKVYCHFDGYISHMGLMLMTHFNSADKARTLIAGGDLSGIEKNGKPRHYRDMEGRENEAPMFDKPYANYADYVASIDTLFHEFNYLFRANGKWEVIEPKRKKKEYVLTKAKSLTRCVSKLPKQIA